MTKAEEKFKAIVLELYFNGIYPGPTILNQRIHNRKSNNLNGRETRWRREVFAQQGIGYKRPGAVTMMETMYDWQDGHSG